jgi:hypothetical protein
MAVKNAEENEPEEDDDKENVKEKQNKHEPKIRELKFKKQKVISTSANCVY